MEENFAEIYMKFKIHFYQEMFAQINERETSLSTVETFCVEIIHALQEPTVQEFASFINISPPNAAYKVNSLIKKGYIEKVQSENDRREYHLKVTDKYYNYYNLSTQYVQKVVGRIRERFGADMTEIEHVLDVINNELMKDLDIIGEGGGTAHVGVFRFSSGDIVGRILA
ncbi:MAG: MarR family transcriptional regulator, partial [Firmicutes bacterium]|nr:MarR family transcriptional regulator [Bacillota bacterium]